MYNITIYKFQRFFIVRGTIDLSEVSELLDSILQLLNFVSQHPLGSSLGLVTFVLILILINNIGKRRKEVCKIDVKHGDKRIHIERTYIH